MESGGSLADQRAGWRAGPPPSPISSTTLLGEAGLIARRDQALEAAHGHLNPVGIERARADRADDPVGACRLRALVGVEELLVELLARADADDLDRDVDVGLVAGEPDHVAREVEDLHRLAHLEHEDLAGAGAEVARLDHELDRLRDRHEVARHVGMGDRHRPALLDLRAEDRDDAARGGEDVAEADDREARLRMAAAGGLRRPTRPSPSSRPSRSAG